MPLLPKLKRLSWELERDSCSFLRLLCNADLASLELRVFSSENACDFIIHGMLASLPKRCPTLKRAILHISTTMHAQDDMPDGTDMLGAATNAIIGWVELEAVEYNGDEELDYDTWLHLATLKTLTSLRWDYDGTASPRTFGVFVRDPFPTLSALYIKGIDMLRWITSFLSLRESWSLRSLEICNTFALDSTEAQNLFDTICSCCSINTLQKLIFEADEGTSDDDCVFNKAIIPSLCRFGQL